MRILIADSYYPGFLADFYRRRPDAEVLPYEAHHAALMSEFFGTGDAYARELRLLGHEAWTVVLNAASLQRRWAVEHDLTTSGEDKAELFRVFLEQVRSFRPDVVYVQELAVAGEEVWRDVRPLTRLIAGQIACSMPSRRTFAHHGLIVSSWPPIVDHFCARGTPAEFLALGFDSKALESLGSIEKRYDLTFVGGIAPVHEGRRQLLEALCRELPIRVFGYGAESLPPDSPVRARHGGEAWGLGMLRLLAQSRITVNVHGDIVVSGVANETLANNCRLFEATGVGAALVTDAKANLSDYFEPGREVRTYASVEECVACCRELLRRPDECAALTLAGQARTLRDHTYAQRMRDLADLLARYL
ncbi:MAG: hypothetical protein BroJett003_15680 [Planctomycetota bacterium]|nr:MAG: hypothetical protein BroJett003_15680 [Planctomycetota bacterium]